MTLPNCPECGSEYTYEDRGLLICPECGNEWSKEEQKNCHRRRISGIRCKWKPSVRRR